MGFINTANNNVSLFSVHFLNERVFYLIFLTMLRSKRGLYETRLEIYRRVPPDEDSVEVDSKEWFFKLILQVREVFLEILVSLNTIISNDLFVHFSRFPDHKSFCSMSMHLYGRKIGSFLSCTFSACISSISKYLEFTTLTGSTFCSGEVLLN